MEQKSKLPIVMILLFIVLIGSIGVYFYNSSKENNIKASLMSTQDIESFNAMFTSYKGVQNGVKVKNLMQKLMENYNTQGNDDGKIPALEYNGIIATVKDDDGVSNSEYRGKYFENLSSIRSQINGKSEYQINFKYGKNSLVSKIIISDI